MRLPLPTIGSLVVQVQIVRVPLTVLSLVLVLVRSFFINKDDRPGVGYVARGYVGTGIRLQNSSASSETTPAFLQYKDA